MSLRRRLRYDRDFRRLVVPPVAVCLISLVVALVTAAILERERSPLERAARLSQLAEFSEADRIYSEILSRGPVETKTLIDFIDNRAHLLEYGGWNEFLDRSGGRHSAPSDVDDIRRLLGQPRIDPEVATLGRFWLAVNLEGGADPTPVVALADRELPVRWANHLLARVAVLEEDWDEAARRFEAEGLAFPYEAEGDLRTAIAIWEEDEKWEILIERSLDPRYREVLGPAFRYSLAVHERDWPAILLWIWPAGFEGLRPWPVLLALVAAVLWFSIAATMGRMDEPVHGRRRLYFAAFGLGVLSIYPTLVLITIEEMVFGFTETGQPIADAIYFVFGVGLREELAKLLLFLPLLPTLNRRGSRIEAMVCGALVGLGFAAGENINYFHRMDLSVALGRFLTANFLHMALTSLVCVAAYDMSSTRRQPTGSLNEAFLIAIVIHGAYDFLLTTTVATGSPLLAMFLFILLAQRFLRELLFAAPDPQRHSILQKFVLSLAILTGLSYIYATTLVGPGLAVSLITTGLLGVVIMIFMFVRELGGD